jgi:L-ascorbate metabolism protein UlaG (beta-lactamase superfamily)
VLDAMIVPHLQDAAFLASVHRALRSPEHLHLWWLGQSGFLVQWQGRHLLFDPYLSDSLTTKYAATDKPHVRMTERVITPESLDFIQVVTSSHNHTDHLDKETLLPLLSANADLELVIPEANRDFVSDRLGIGAVQPKGLNAGKTLQLAGFCIHAVPAAHNEIETDADGRHKFLGYVAGPSISRCYQSTETCRNDAWQET